MFDQRARLLRAALGFLALEPREPELRLLHQCFDNWRGIGDVVAFHGAAGIRPGATSLQRPRMARRVLSEWIRAFANVAPGHSVRAQPVAGGTESSWRRAGQASRSGARAARLDVDGRDTAVSDLRPRS